MSYINQTVNVNAFYFAGTQRKMFPRSIELDNTRYTFQDGLQYLVRSGQRAFRLFEMSDGNRTYRIKAEDGEWTLIGTRG
jgi:hypothetical protein